MRRFLGKVKRKLAETAVYEPRRLPWPTSQAQTGVALVTMVNNEDVLLTHWLTHYMRLLDAPRFFVIDDASDQVDTAEVIRRAGAEHLCDVIRLPAGPFSDLYKSSTLSSLANIMVERCAVVITSDVDEIVTPLGNARDQDFEALLRAAPAPFASPIGVLPVHDRDTEPPFDPFQPLAGQRNWGYLHGPSTKPAIWKGQTAVFTAGQHTLWERKVPVITNLATMHLRWVDHDTALRRQAVRNGITYAAAQRENQGGHWKIAPDKLPSNRFMDPVKFMADAGDITDVAPAFIRKHMVERNGDYILKKRNILEAVRLTGCI